MSCGSTTRSSAIVFGPSTRQHGGPDFWLSIIFLRLARCHERWRQRQALLNLDDHLLADIGVSRQQAVKEASKPFWQ